jgi:conjugal transfer pilus assembly protein TraB
MKFDWKTIDPKALLNKQITKVILGSVALVIVSYLIFGGESKQKTAKSKGETPTKIMSATDVLPLDKMNKQYLEEKIDDSRDLASKQIKALDSKIDENKGILKKELLEDIEKQKQQISKEIEDQKEENKKLSEQIKFLKASLIEMHENTVAKNNAKAKINIIEVDNVSKRGFKIPANRFASGTLEHGAVVSTATSSASNPIPIKITLEKGGNLPEGFLDIYEKCSITGASVGNRSDERVHVRLESMTCRDKRTKEEVETDLAGYITDEGGNQGIIGTLVEANGAMLQKSFAGGLLSGLANTGKKQSTSVWPFGPQPQNGFNNRLQDGLMNGAESSMDRLSKYYLEQAEKVQPVIQIESGRRVDIHFTQTVHMGEKGTHKKVAANREQNNLSGKED